MEPKFVQKNEPEIQITRLAPSSTKISGLFKTGMTIKLQTTKRYTDGDKAKGSTSGERDFPSAPALAPPRNRPLSHQYMEGVRSLDNGIVSLQFDREKDNENCLDWLDSVVSGVTISSTTMEPGINDGMNRKKRTTINDLQMDSCSLENFESNSFTEEQESIEHNEIYRSENHLKAGALDDALNESSIWQTSETVHEIKTIQRAPGKDLNWSFSPFQFNSELIDNCPLIGLNHYESFHRTLMADIDLHLELENYLKAIYSNESITKRFAQEKINQTVNECFEQDDHIEYNKSITTEKDVVPIEEDELQGFDDVDFTLPLKSQTNIFLIEDTLPSSAPQIDGFDKNQTRRETVKRVKSENDRNDITDNINEFDSYIRRTYGKTNFELSPDKSKSISDAKSIHKVPEDKYLKNVLAKMTLPVINIPLFDQYDKINGIEKFYDRLQFIFAPEDRIDEPLSFVKTKTSVLGRILESQPIKFETNQPKLLDNIETWVENDDQQLEPVSSVEELLKMYNSVLRERKKNMKIQQEQSNRKATDSLLSFIDVLLRAKKNDSDTIKLPQITNPPAAQSSVVVSRYFNARHREKKQGKTYLTLEEYVNMVQKMLSSALSIQQITMLNDMAARLQEKPERKTNGKIKRKKKSLKLVSNKKVKDIKKPEGSQKVKMNFQMKTNDRKKPRKIFKKVKSNRKKESESSAVKIEPEITQSCGELAHTYEKQMENAKSLELSSPEVLKSFLTSQFHLVKSNLRLQKNSTDTKLVVTVKLSGEKILVDAVTQIQNENVLQEIHDSKETSDLIIENVRGKQLNRLLFDRENGNEISIKEPNKQSQIVRKKIFNQEPLFLTNNEDRSIINKNTIRRKIKTSKNAENRNSKTLLNENEISDTVPAGDFLFKERSLTSTDSPMKLSEKISFYNLYEYDQEKLKAQHPIEAIMESSESKIDEIFSETSKSTENNYFQGSEDEKIVSGFRERKEKIIKGANSSTLMKSRNRRTNDKKLSRTMSYIFNVNSDDFSTAQNGGKKGVKSLEDTSFRKNVGSRKRNLRKKMQARCCNVLCYLFSLKSNENKIKEKKSITGNDFKSECGRQSKKTITTIKSNSEKPKISNKALKMDKNDKNEEKKVGKSKKIRSEKRSHHTKSTTVKEETKSDDGLVKFLYNDCVHSSNMSQQSSESEEPQKLVKSHDTTPPYPSDRPHSGRNIEKSAGSENGQRELPIIIHAPKDKDLEISFPSLMIRSESFIKSRSTFALTKSRIKSLFKSNSDMKFFPGKVAEADSEPQQHPFVTFVLTPKQKPAAGVPSNQIQVVSDKKYILKNDDIFDLGEHDKFVTHQKNDLKSIEKFIQTLSKCAIKENSKKPKENTKENDKKGKNKSSNKTEARTILTRPKLAESKKSEVSHPRCTTPKRKEKALLLEPPTKNETKPYNKQSGALNNPYSALKFQVQVPEVKKLKSTETRIFKKDGEDLNFDKKETKSIEKFSKDRTKSKSTFELLKLVDQVVKTPSNETKIIRPETLEPEKGAGKPTNLSKCIKNESDATTSSLVQKGSNKSSNVTLGSSNSNKNLKAYKIKISCNAKKSQSAEVNFVVKKKPEKRDRSLQRLSSTSKKDPSSHDVRALDRLIDRNIPLERTPSVYFDAEGSSQTELQTEPLEEEEEGAMKPVDSGVFISQGTHNSSRPTTSLLSSSHQHQSVSNIEEKLLDQVMENLHIENVASAIILLETFFKKFDKTDENTGKTSEKATIQDVLESIENKTKCLMEKMEMNGWLKVLARLEEISQIFSSQVGDELTSAESDLSLKILLTKSVEPKMTASLEYLEKQVCNARKLMNAIQTLIDKTLVTQKKSSKSLLDGENHRRNLSMKLIGTIGDSLKYLKNKIIPTDLKLSNIISWSDVDDSRGSEIFQVAESDSGEKRMLQSLRKQVREKRLRIQYLMSVDSGPVFPKVQNLKNLVAEKLQSLEKALSDFEAVTIGKTPENTENSKEDLQKFSFFNIRLTHKTSVINLIKTSRSYLFGECSSGSEIEIVRNTENAVKPSTSGFFNSLMRLWDGCDEDGGTSLSSDISN